MKKLLNTLYVQTQGMYLRREGESVVAEKDREVKMRLPIHTLQGIVAFGNVMVSPFLLGLCAERGVCVSFLTESGRFQARVSGPVSGNVLLRLAQMRAYDDRPKKGDIARSFLIGKLMNARNVLMRRLRDHGESAQLSSAAAKIADVLRRVKDSPSDAARLRGPKARRAQFILGASTNSLLLSKRVFR